MLDRVLYKARQQVSSKLSQMGNNAPNSTHFICILKYTDISFSFRRSYWNLNPNLTIKINSMKAMWQEAFHKQSTSYNEGTISHTQTTLLYLFQLFRNNSTLVKLRSTQYHSTSKCRPLHKKLKSCSCNMPYLLKMRAQQSGIQHLGKLEVVRSFQFHKNCWQTEMTCIRYLLPQGLKLFKQIQKLQSTQMVNKNTPLT